MSARPPLPGAHGPAPVRPGWTFVVTVLLGLFLAGLAAPAPAAGLTDFLARVPADGLFPGADAYGAAAGEPPVVPVLAAGRVVLAAGVLQSPLLLWRSGIGPAAH